MRAGLPRLAVLVSVGLAYGNAAPIPAVFCQERPLEAVVGGEQQPATEQPVPAGPGAGAGRENEGQNKGAGPSVQASQLDTFLLRDGKGNLVPVLGLPFEEFEQLLRLKRGLTAPAAPSYTLEALSVSGTADERMADLQITATIRVREEGWVRVPLLMPQGVIRQSAKHEGPGEHVLAFDEASGGYVCWLKGNDARPHVVTLQISVAVNTLGDERRLALSLPRATESSLRVSLPETSAEALLTAGEGILTSRASGGRTEIAVLGPAGEMQMVWRPRREGTSKASAQLDASGEISVRIQSEHRITSEARLRVRSFGAALETFRVRLPPGMELVPAPAVGGYSVTALAADAEESSKQRNRPAAQMVEVRLEKPTPAIAEVLLRAQKASDLATPAPLMPARFEVVGAVRQRGTIDFSMDGEWKLDWTEDKSVHRIDLTPDASQARVVARYEYFRQPCGLELKVAARPSRVSVEPVHVVFVDPRQVRIETTLKYRFRGARTEGLAFDLGDWKLDRLAPDQLLELPTFDPATNQLQAAFRIGAATGAELELKLEAHRTLPAGTDRLALTLPRPLADIVAPATIAIYSADNVELKPQVAELVGLSPDQATLRLPGRQQPPLVYRDLGSGERAEFVGSLRTLSRTTTTAGRARVRIERGQVQIEQRLDYRVQHESQRSFWLAAPREVTASGNMQVWLAGEPLAVAPAAEAAGPATLVNRLQFSTPTDQIGAFQIEVRYALPLDWDRKGPHALTIPLVLPADDENNLFTAQQIEFSSAEGATIEPDLENGDEGAEPAASGNGTMPVYTFSGPISHSHWTLEPGRGPPEGPVGVSQMWVQTWLGPQVRRERVALRLNTVQDTVRIRLPNGVHHPTLLTVVDGQKALHTIRPPSLVLLSMPAAARGRECAVEIYYSLDSPESSWGVVREELRTVRLEEAAAPRRVYWQVALPEDEYLIAPAGMAAEMAWSSGWWLGGRRPVMDQMQLETWIKASRQEGLPRGVNEYLFGTLGRWPTLRLTGAQRRLVVAVASGAILMLGLLLVHVSRLRSPGVLFAVGVAIIGGAVAAPELVLVAAQGAVLGVLIATAAAAFAWISSGRTILPAVQVKTAVSGQRERSSSSQSLERPERSSRISTTATRSPLVEARP